MSDCVIEPNSVAIGESVAEISRFLEFSRWRLPPSWIFEISNFHGLNGHEGRFVPLCQISWKLLKVRQRYGYFSIIKTKKMASVSLFCKSRRFKTANIKILSANSTHRSYRSHLFQPAACHKCKSHLLCLEFAVVYLVSQGRGANFSTIR